jgi:methionine-rich copper-binding protein CopC
MTPRVLASAALVLVALVIAPAPALGHASLLAADPPDGGTLSTTPYTLTLTFDEPLGAAGSSVVVRDAAGTEVATGGISDQSATVMTAQLPSLPAGEYVVRWTAQTPDDQAVERGTLTFTVGSATATPAAPASPGPSDPTPGPASGNDLLLALIVAGLALAAIVGFLVIRNRR